jgi:hypothetical protein
MNMIRFGRIFVIKAVLLSSLLLGISTVLLNLLGAAPNRPATEMGLPLGEMDMTADSPDRSGFIDHGVAVPLASRRGVVAARDANARNLAIACSMDFSGPRGWILVTDIDSGKTEQVWFPQGAPNLPPYGSLLARSGKFYTAAGDVLLEFDPGSRQWTFQGAPVPGEECYLSVVEDSDGLIYAGSCPHSHLVSFDPKTRQMAVCVQMDPQEAYLWYLAIDKSGWIYGGIGTSKHDIVAYNPKTKERRPLIKPEDRKIGTANVYMGTDGQVYGYGSADSQWYRLSEGKAIPIARAEATPKAATGAIYYGDIHDTFPDGRKIRAYDLEEKYLEVEDAKTGQVRRIDFDYKCGGTIITMITAGPDGNVHGCSGHPSHGFMYNPRSGVLEHYPGTIYLQCATIQGRYVMGSEYPGGNLYRHDPAQPWNLSGPEDQRNPRRVAQYAPDIYVPRVTLAHPDGRHVFMAGLPAYGYRGGGVGIYDLESGESSVLTHKELIPEQSTVTMRLLPDGNIIAGTSVAAGHGARPISADGVLYILDWQARKITFQTAPVRGANAVQALEIGPDGLVYGLASGSNFFVFDPNDKKILYQEKLSGHGEIAQSGLTLAADGNIYALFSKAIVRIVPGTFKHEKLADTPGPIRGGGAILSGRVYFSIGSHLWSYRLPGGA